MTGFYIFLLRIILGGLFAVILMRLFYPDASLPWVAACGAALVGLAYVTEYFRKQRKGP